MNSETDTGTATAAARTLYEISVDYSDIEQLMDSIDLDAISDEDEARIARFVADLQNERDKKFDNCGGFIRSQELLGRSQVDEGDRIKALGSTKLNKAKYLKARLLGFMQFHKVDKPIHTERFRFSRAGNGGKAPVNLTSAAENNPVELPERYRRVTYTPHLDNIREDLERLAVIEKVFATCDAIANGKQDYLDSVGEKYIAIVSKYTSNEIEDLKTEREDLATMLTGVGSLGERGEHLRIA